VKSGTIREIFWLLPVLSPLLPVVSQPIYMEVLWMVLYKITVFRSSLIFNMAARVNNVLWLAEISKFFFSETNVLTELKLYINDQVTVFYVNLKSKMAAYVYEPILCMNDHWMVGELLSPLSVRRLLDVRPLAVHILINSSEATGTIWTKLWWNGPWMAPFQNCVRWSRLPTKMAAKLKIEKGVWNFNYPLLL
jgi:hypothetical protein